METELDLARAAYDSQLGNETRIREEAAEQRRLTDERVAPLVQELAAVRSQLTRAESELSERSAECARLSDELASSRLAAPKMAMSAEAARRTAELESAIAAQSVQLEELTRELHVAQEERDRLAELCRRDRAQDSSMTESALAEHPAASVTEPASAWPRPAEGTCPASRVEELETIESPTSWGQVEAEPTWPVVAEQPKSAESITAPDVDDQFEPALTCVAPVAAEPASEETESATPELPPAPSWAACTTPAPEIVQADDAATETRPAPSWAAQAAEEPASEYNSTSFIDKYRHLLEDDGQMGVPQEPASPRSILNDEYLSPAKAETTASPADDSDEALEAYMESMMRRVRSNSPSYASSQAPASEGEMPAAAPFAHPALASIFPTEAEMAPAPMDAPLMDFEELKLAARKPAPATDLAVLREIANSSARTALASHSQRQSHESALSKIVVALTALVSSAYLMASAPEIDNWQFWAGVAACTVGFAASVQVLILERRGAVKPRKPRA
jgi:hypothetical protein